MTTDRAREVQLWVRSQMKIAIANEESCDRAIRAINQSVMEYDDPLIIPDLEKQQNAYKFEKAKHQATAEMLHDVDTLIGIARKDDSLTK